MAQFDEIEMARKAITRVTRAEIRLRYSLMADLEINSVLSDRLRNFDEAVQQGILPSYALKLVSGERDATD
jgi:hypothetical protein